MEVILGASPASEYVLPGDRINAIVGDCSGCNAQLPGCDAQRTLAGIKVECQFRIIVDTVVVFNNHAMERLLKFVAVSDWYSLVDELWSRAAQLGDVLYDDIPFLVGITHGCTMEQADIAPALTNGVEGWSFSNKMAMIELNGSPPWHRRQSCPILSVHRTGAG